MGKEHVKKRDQLERVVIVFAGDSGDGMQLTGSQFSDTSAFMGNDISTFPDYPAEIRAPQGTIAGVSGFQVHIGSDKVITPGDEADMLVAMNPAALKSKLGTLKLGGVLLVNTDAFSAKNLEKAKYETSPLDDGSLDEYQVIQAPISTQVQEALKDIDIEAKAKGRCKNFYALGMTYYIYNRSLDQTVNWIEKKFISTPLLIEANKTALKAGLYFAETLEVIASTYTVPKAKIDSGTYRQINGNTGTAWGLMKAAESAELSLFLGSYPITPASDILHELSKHPSVKTFQAEDEIAAVCSAIGASWSGHLALTTSSGPGISLKGEALGLAVSYEIPLVVVNVQRGGPSTGLPTKTEQSDLFQAMYARNGEAPMIVVAPSRPNDCFEMAYEAARLALKFMIPVFFLSDGYVANGAEPWRIPDLDKELRDIEHHLVDTSKVSSGTFKHFNRDSLTLARPWVVPGMEGLEYRLGGLEKDFHTGAVSADPMNHEKMCYMRQSKVDLAQNDIPEQEVFGAESGELLVISWGGTYGPVYTAVERLQTDGYKVSHAHLKYLNPFPKNLGKVLENFRHIIVPELNLGQLNKILKARFGGDILSYTQVQGLPFKSTQLERAFKTILTGDQLNERAQENSL